MFPNVKNGWRIVIVVIIIIIILNPSYTDFKEYTGLLGKDTNYLHKKNNFLIFSIYENAKYKKTYLGVLMNFIDITRNETDPSDSTTVKRNTTTLKPNTIYRDSLEEANFLKSAIQIDTSKRVDEYGIPIRKKQLSKDEK